MDVDPQGGALHQVRLLRLRVQLDGVRPGVPRAGGAREGHALRRRRARRGEGRAARGRTRTSTGSGTARAATSATSAARRASTRATRSRSSAPRRSRRASTATWARSTRSGSSPRRRRPAGCARPSSCRRRRASLKSLKEVKFAMGLAKHGKVPPPFPPHVAEGRERGARALRPREGAGPRRAPGIVQGEQALARLEFEQSGDAGRDPYGEGSFPQPYLPGRETTPRRRRVKTVAYYKGCLASLSAKELDTSTQALAPKVGLELDRARVGHVLRRRRHPRGGARLLPAPERAHPRVRRGDRLRHADDGLQRLHAQPAAGELPAARATRRCSRA